MGDPNTGMNVDAKNYLSTAPSWGLVAYKNGGTPPPQMGDIICSNGNGVNKGHVAIVRQVLGDSIRVIHQNWANSIGLASENYYNKDANYYPLKMTLSGGKYTVSALGSGYPVTGWLHKP
jgi:surface antigen